MSERTIYPVTVGYDYVACVDGLGDEFNPFFPHGTKGVFLLATERGVGPFTPEQAECIASAAGLLGFHDNDLVRGLRGALEGIRAILEASSSEEGGDANDGGSHGRVETTDATTPPDVSGGLSEEDSKYQAVLRWVVKFPNEAATRIRELESDVEMLTELDAYKMEIYTKRAKERNEANANLQTAVEALKKIVYRTGEVSIDADTCLGLWRIATTALNAIEGA